MIVLLFPLVFLERKSVPRATLLCASTLAVSAPEPIAVLEPPVTLFMSAE